MNGIVSSLLSSLIHYILRFIRWKNTRKRKMQWNEKVRNVMKWNDARFSFHCTFFFPVIYHLYLVLFYLHFRLIFHHIFFLFSDYILYLLEHHLYLVSCSWLFFFSWYILTGVLPSNLTLIIFLGNLIIYLAFWLQLNTIHFWIFVFSLYSVTINIFPYLVWFIFHVTGVRILSLYYLLADISCRL